ncbi:MAG: hypothetical protein A2498_00830 [Lentisphaerae bacterium RIFOXYC12_FULL_60_16]|nr:MAG: hypothetical protein A2498_00830 [Lentisphaerae bacterium RIFOXYC12_FULL_60_16]
MPPEYQPLIDPDLSLFHSLAEESPSMVFVNQGGRVVYCNRKVELVTGYQRSEVLSTNFDFTCLLDEPSRQLAMEGLASHAQGEFVPPKEYRVITKAGRPIDTVIAVSLIDFRGQPAVLGVVTDISAQKQMFRDLANQRDQMRQFLDLAAVIMVALDDSGHVLMINRKGTEILECSAEETIGQDWFESFIPPDQRAQVRKVFQSLLTTTSDSMNSAENLIRTKTGRDRLIHWRSTVCRDEEGRLRYVLSSGLDLTEERAISETLKHSETQYRDLYENTPIGLCRLSVKGCVISANRHFIRMLGMVSEVQLQGVPADRLFHHLTPSVQLMERLERYGYLRGTEVRLQRMDGAGIWTRMSARVLRDSDGRTQHYELAVEDITRQKEVERKLARQTELERIVTRMAAGLVSVQPDDGTAVIRSNLESLARFFGGDRGFLCRFGESEGGHRIFCQWTASGIRRRSVHLPTDEPGAFPKVVTDIKRGHSVVLARIDTFAHPDSLEGRSFAACNVQSFLGVPLMTPQGCLGFLGIDRVRTACAWEPELVELLALAGRVIAGWVSHGEVRDGMQTRLRLYTQTTRMMVRLGESTASVATDVMNHEMEAMAHAIAVDGMAMIRSLTVLPSPVLSGPYQWSGRGDTFGTAVIDSVLSDATIINRLKQGEMVHIRRVVPSLDGSVMSDMVNLIVLPFSSDNGQSGCVLLWNVEAFPFRIDDELISVLEIVGEVCVRSLDRIETIAARNEERRLMDTLMEATPDHIYFKDEKSRFIRLSRTLLRRLGLHEMQEVIGKTDYDFFSDEHALQALADEQAILQTGRPVLNKEEKETWPDGLEAWVSTSKVPLRAPDGKIIGTFGISRDITDQKHAESERLRFHQKMQQVQKLESLGTLSGGIAHDFNNLLMGILGNTELALMDVVPESPTWKRIKQIEMTALRASELTGQMLTYAGKVSAVFEPLDVNSLVQEMARFLEVSIPSAVRLDYQLRDSLPMIDGDATQVRQVVMNLITNAADALSGKDGTITIRTGMEAVSRHGSESLIHALTPGDYVYFEVTDTGCGMSPDIQQRIFDPFFTTKKTGHGLGLAAVLGIVKAHHGTIRLTSQVGVGTSFRVYFPPGTLKRTEMAAHPTVVPGARLGQNRILVMDDDEIIRSVLREVLERNGYSVKLVVDESALLALLEDDSWIPDLVILDVFMAGRPSVSCVGQLHKQWPKLPVLLTSGLNEGNATGQMPGVHYAGFIQKPFDVRSLLTCIHELSGLSNDVPATDHQTGDDK